MFKIVKKEIIWGGKKLSIETGKIARQADGAVILTSGDTVILATVVGAKKANPETDFFPLTVNYQEKYYASGKIPGGYFKREARPTESETLISRLIDRPIRPLFPEGFRNEVQVLPTVLSYEKDNDPEILSLIAASAALSISGIPFMGPVAASKVGYINGSFVLEQFTEMDVESQFKNIEKEIVRTKILKEKKRIDGRGLADIRPIKCEVGILPRAHGSALFTRGETQAIVVTTLGTSEDEQRIESLDGLQRSRFMLHYNFPPFSVGEVGRIGTGRREIGHGKLAWRAVNSILPKKEEFPYTFRLVSEITESNGSSSMATVCGSSLALMDAGVPIKKPVAGIAMGLIKEGADYSVLSDILGDEDHLGDMDFKVAGTEDGITSLQMDIKITGITFEIMEKALSQAKDGRIHILGEMNKALKVSRKDLSKHTPKMEKVTVDKKDIAAIIGKGGVTIREIVELSGAKVDISDDGIVTIAAPDEISRNKALEMVKSIIAKAEVGKIYTGKVVKIMEFGAFVNFLGKQDGLVHISELAAKRVEKVSDVVKEGDEVKVKVLGFDKGKVKLSIKQALDS
ncbi:MAG: polyribonucleotide nucleotidyltransferase [Candidatus Fonsibacter ubiquis]|nr:polyribonucleotide nucleotidyltransferase [Candidatus Fonsibacter ubiquis]